MPNSKDPAIARNEVLRKGLHLAVALFPLLMLRMGKEASLMILAPVTLAAVGADVLRSLSPRVEAVIQRVFGLMMRAEESAPRKVRINGATWVLITLTLLTLVFDLKTAANAFMMSMVADAAAAVVGKLLGTHKWKWSQRTIEGSLAFVAFSAAVGLVLRDFLVPTILFASILGAAVESLPGPLNDNLRVPVCIALGLLVGSFLF